MNMGQRIVLMAYAGIVFFLTFFYMPFSSFLGKGQKIFEDFSLLISPPKYGTSPDVAIYILELIPYTVMAAVLFVILKRK